MPSSKTIHVEPHLTCCAIHPALFLHTYGSLQFLTFIEQDEPNMGTLLKVLKTPLLTVKVDRQRVRAHVTCATCLLLPHETTRTNATHLPKTLTSAIRAKPMMSKGTLFFRRLMNAPPFHPTLTPPSQPPPNPQDFSNALAKHNGYDPVPAGNRPIVMSTGGLRPYGALDLGVVYRPSPEIRQFGTASTCNAPTGCVTVVSNKYPRLLDRNFRRRGSAGFRYPQTALGNCLTT